MSEDKNFDLPIGEVLNRATAEQVLEIWREETLNKSRDYLKKLKAGYEIMLKEVDEELKKRELEGYESEKIKI